ncbi:hypothetical protein [[Eubacterium] cellulosolvens]
MEFERLGSFYLGKEYDIKTEQLLDRLLMYDSRDLTTHAVCVGMTGSGKTGLCIGLLEEAAIDHVPAIIIDPKGDITNLLLTFPELRPQDFRSWINIDDARRKGMSEDEFASQQSELWRNGLKEWGQDGARIKLLHESADFVIYTPGSDAGIPVSIMQSLSVPNLNWQVDAELIRERIQGTVSALLSLIDVEADPVRSREHILLANLFEHFWRQGEDLDLFKLIGAIQKPPLQKLGAFDVEAFYPSKERFELARNLNNIIASPSFHSWLNGQPLDIPRFLNDPRGKTRHSIFYIAHLSDPERMFFVTMLLNQLMTWIRSQPGTTSLRALLYMDEIFGFFPPVANPSSKKPMLTLLKQARAFGLGVVLTTQNPIDLDYKGLTNTGTWFIGRLQTERDKTRLLDGLEGVSSTTGKTLDREDYSRIISSLGKRVFLMHNVHEETPLTFQTRWVMSYLRGPLTRTQVQNLMGSRQPDIPLSKQAIEMGIAASRVPSSVTPFTNDTTSTLHTLPTEIPQAFLPHRKGKDIALQELEKRAGDPIQPQSIQLHYAPSVLGMGHIYFRDRRLNLDYRQPFALLTQDVAIRGMQPWKSAQQVDINPQKLEDQPEHGASFDPIPESINETRKLNTLKKGLTEYIYHHSSLKLLYSPLLKIYSQPEESEREFIAWLNQAAREQRDKEVDKIEKRYEKSLQTLKNRLFQAQAIMEKKQYEAEARKREVMVSAGETVLGMFLGRRSTRGASTALSKYRQRTAAKMSAEHAKKKVEDLRQEIADLENKLRKQTDAVIKRWDEALNTVSDFPIKPKKSDIALEIFAVAWVPHWRIAYIDKGVNHREDIPTT